MKDRFKRDVVSKDLLVLQKIVEARGLVLALPPGFYSMNDVDQLTAVNDAYTTVIEYFMAGYV